MPLFHGEAVLVAIFGNGHARHILHHKERPAFRGRARVENASDVRVIHKRQRLAFGLKPCNHGFGVHAGLDQL